MCEVTKFTKTDVNIGLSVRTPTEGPEWDLVRLFIDDVTSKFSHKKFKLAVFCEPRLNTGFPDVVFVKYAPDILESWDETRFLLNSLDLKVLHHLHHVGEADIILLQKHLGIKQTRLTSVLSRLNDSKLIRLYQKKWRPISIKKTFAVKNIIAVEAKIGGWQRAFQQAQTNTWFASESYVLSSVSNPTNRTINLSKELGIGLYTYNTGGAKKIISPTPMRLPACYASWQFNEWLGRHMNFSN